MLGEKRVEGHVILVDGQLWTWKLRNHIGPDVKGIQRFPDLGNRYFPTATEIPDNGVHKVRLVSVVCPSWAAADRWLNTFTSHEKAPTQFSQGGEVGPFHEEQDICCQREWSLSSKGSNTWWKDGE